MAAAVATATAKLLLLRLPLLLLLRLQLQVFLLPNHLSLILLCSYCVVLRHPLTDRGSRANSFSGFYRGLCKSDDATSVSIEVDKVDGFQVFSFV